MFESREKVSLVTKSGQRFAVQARVCTQQLERNVGRQPARLVHGRMVHFAEAAATETAV